jgi:hypothetical protein
MKTTTKTDKSIEDAGGSQTRPHDQDHARTSQRFAAWSMTPSCRVAIHGDRSRMTQSMRCASQTNF